ncbi:MAG: hypothetical protein JW726_12405 [Anaerolineales bacterium]|nr:hypothetical protein [Anaerolineales bacterium]
MKADIVENSSGDELAETESQAAEKRGVLTPTMPSNIRDEAAGSWKQFCPYVGLENDSQSLTSFPSPLNMCYRTATPQVVTIEHQSTYCLVEQHVRCPVFLQQKATKKKPLLKQLLGGAEAVGLPKP